MTSILPIPTVNHLSKIIGADRLERLYDSAASVFNVVKQSFPFMTCLTPMMPVSPMVTLTVAAYPLYSLGYNYLYHDHSAVIDKAITDISAALKANDKTNLKKTIETILQNNTSPLSSNYFYNNDRKPFNDLLISLENKDKTNLKKTIETILQNNTSPLSSNYFYNNDRTPFNDLLISLENNASIDFEIYCSAQEVISKLIELRATRSGVLTKAHRSPKHHPTLDNLIKTLRGLGNFFIKFTPLHENAIQDYRDGLEDVIHLIKVCKQTKSIFTTPPSHTQPVSLDKLDALKTILEDYKNSNDHFKQRDHTPLLRAIHNALIQLQPLSAPIPEIQIIKRILNPLTTQTHLQATYVIIDNVSDKGELISRLKQIITQDKSHELCDAFIQGVRSCHLVLGHNFMQNVIEAALINPSTNPINDLRQIYTNCPTDELLEAIKHAHEMINPASQEDL